MSDAAGKDSIVRQVIVALIVAGATGILGLVFTYHQAILGYLFPNKPMVRPTIAQAEVLSAVVKDLERTEPEMQPERRYLSLVHLHNDPTVTEAHLERTRSALRELITWIAPTGQVPALEPVDGRKMVLALNLGEIKWSAKKQWRALLEQYPYGLDQSGSKEEGLAAAVTRVQKLAGEGAVIRGDWFVAAVIRPPLGGPEGTLGTAAREVPAAVRAFGQEYPEQTVTLEQAAREIGSKPELVKAKILAVQRLSEKCGLAPLTRGETISRASWESRRFTTSPYQELAQELDLGIPEAR